MKSNLPMNFCSLANCIVHGFLKALKFPLLFRSQSPQITEQKKMSNKQLSYNKLISKCFVGLKMN